MRFGARPRRKIQGFVLDNNNNNTHMPFMHPISKKLVFIDFFKGGEQIG
jgi:hypothetical protein